MFEKRINGLILINCQSGVNFYLNPCNECKQAKLVKDCCYKCKNPIYYGEEKDFEKHYFTRDSKIYSDKLSKFVFRCNEKMKGSVIERISIIYSHIYIDEVQDLAGYDLELLKLLFANNSKILLVGDPRQGTYSTNSAPKNKQFRKSKVENYFFQDKTINIFTDRTSLQTNFRSNKEICDLSNKLFPDFDPTTSGNKTITAHDGVFLFTENDVDSYLSTYKPIQLRDSRKKEVHSGYDVMNFGESKGLTFDRVLIYPTKPFIDGYRIIIQNWLKPVGQNFMWQ